MLRGEQGPAGPARTSQLTQQGKAQAEGKGSDLRGPGGPWGGPSCGPGVAGSALSRRDAVTGIRLLQQSFPSWVPTGPLLTLLFGPAPILVSGLKA